MLVDHILGPEYYVENPSSARTDELLHPIVAACQFSDLFRQFLRGQRNMPSAKVFCTPGMCSDTWLQPPLISWRRSILIIKHALLSLAQPHRLTHVAAAEFSPRNTIESPADAGSSPCSSSISHAVATIPKSSSKLIVMVQVSRRSAFRFSYFVGAGGTSYLQ